MRLSSSFSGTSEAESAATLLLGFKYFFARTADLVDVGVSNSRWSNPLVILSCL
ncbi:unnamed protein product [Camellia sinensis]